jgi:hypothetical protein
MLMIKTHRAQQERGTRFALVIRACDTGHITEILEVAGEDKEMNCPVCHKETHFEKAYLADKDGNVLE